jgi:hypothetical protein
MFDTGRLARRASEHLDPADVLRPPSACDDVRFRIRTRNVFYGKTQFERDRPLLAAYALWVDWRQRTKTEAETLTYV